MMSRLEEIKHDYRNAEYASSFFTSIKNINWLIKQAELREEQVQRNLQALENINVLERIYDRLESENQRYKQALEQVWEMTKESIMDGRIYIVVDKALKGESE